MSDECWLYAAALFVDSFALAVAVLAWRRANRRQLPPRSARMIVEIDGRTFIDIDSKMALALVDCEYGRPVVNDYAVHGVQLRLTLREGGIP